VHELGWVTFGDIWSWLFLFSVCLGLLTFPMVWSCSTEPFRKYHTRVGARIFKLQAWVEGPGWQNEPSKTLLGSWSQHTHTSLGDCRTVRLSKDGLNALYNFFVLKSNFHAQGFVCVLRRRPY
jgi:hypothetical protein